jgi:hypothetical protein
MLEAASKYVSVTHTAAWCLSALLAGLWLLTRMKPDFRTCHLKVQSFQELRNRVQERVYAVTRSRGVSYVSDLISKLSDIDVTSFQVISVATHEGFQIEWTKGASSTHQGGKPRVGKKAVAPDTASIFAPKLMTGTKRKQDQEKEGADVKKRKQDQVPEVTAAWRIHRAHEGVMRLREADTAAEAARHAGDHSQRNGERLPRAARLQDAAVEPDLHLAFDGLPAVDNDEQDAVNNDEQDAVNNDDRGKCLVCFEYLPASGQGVMEDLTTLSCRHTFHTSCIQMWTDNLCGSIDNLSCPSRCEVDRSAAAAIDIVPEVKVAGLGGESLGMAPESVLLLMQVQS